MKFIASLILFVLLCSGCYGGEVVTENPCEPSEVSTGGWPGHWQGSQYPCPVDMPKTQDMTKDSCVHGEDMPTDHSHVDMTPDMWDMSIDRDIKKDLVTDQNLDQDSTPDMPPICDYSYPGRSVTILLQLTNPDVPEYIRQRLVFNAVRWATYYSDNESTRILMVRDDNHNGEFSSEPQDLANLIQTWGYEVVYIQEPKEGLTKEDLEDFDVVWFSNPGWPMDDMKTKKTLSKFAQLGFGVIISGDDMTHGEMSQWNDVTWKSNGTKTCGQVTDNNRGKSYKVRFKPFGHEILDGLEGKEFYYANDIDHVELNPTTQSDVQAWAQFGPDQNACYVETPVIFTKEIPVLCN